MRRDVYVGKAEELFCGDFRYFQAIKFRSFRFRQHSLYCSPYGSLSPITQGGRLNVASQKKDLRIKSQPAVAEIDRQVADYKLFRSLTALFFFDIVFVCTIGAFNYRRLLISFALMVLAGARYLFLLNWTQQLTFEYYTLIVGRGKTPAEIDSDPLGG